MPWMQAAVVLVTGSGRALSQLRTSHVTSMVRLGFAAVENQFRCLSKDDNELLLHNNHSSWDLFF